MPYTPNPFAHEALAAQREERLARKAAIYHAIYHAIGNTGKPQPSLRRSLANGLRAAANRLAQPEPVAPAQAGPNHIHIRPESQPQVPSKG